MATQGDWSAKLTQCIAWQIRRRRKAIGWSARDLSAACDGYGYNIPRTVIADLENGRRQSISVPELLTLSWALKVPPIDLVYPLELGDGSALSPSTLDVVLAGRDWWRSSINDPDLTKDVETSAAEMTAIAEAVSGLNDLLTRQKEEFTRKLAEQQKLLDTLIVRPGQGGRQERGEQQLRALESIATLSRAGIDFRNRPDVLLYLREQEVLDDGILQGTVFCVNGHEVPSAHKFCPECGVSIARADNEDLARLHLQTLRKMCRERGLPDTGARDELIARLTV